MANFRLQKVKGRYYAYGLVARNEGRLHEGDPGNPRPLQSFGHREVQPPRPGDARSGNGGDIRGVIDRPPVSN